jgi:hypothetical protein
LAKIAFTLYPLHLVDNFWTMILFVLLWVYVFVVLCAKRTFNRVVLSHTSATQSAAMSPQTI